MEFHRGKWFWFSFWLFMLLAEGVCGWIFVAILIDSVVDLTRPTAEVTVALLLDIGMAVIWPILIYRFLSALWQNIAMKGSNHE